MRDEGRFVSTKLTPSPDRELRAAHSNGEASPSINSSTGLIIPVDEQSSPTHSNCENALGLESSISHTNESSPLITSPEPCYSTWSGSFSAASAYDGFSDTADSDSQNDEPSPRLTAAITNTAQLGLPEPVHSTASGTFSAAAAYDNSSDSEVTSPKPHSSISLGQTKRQFKRLASFPVPNKVIQSSVNGKQVPHDNSRGPKKPPLGLSRPLLPPTSLKFQPSRIKDLRVTKDRRPLWPVRASSLAVNTNNHRNISAEQNLED
ncbi:uncharacterized protein B0I36DRAFT_30202 [Microdochium trichocladiopsis]|uniref:Uncharacterized protein n=1 Tax=Microdochium trichocladiopsis TaxID=1682393 RepID=A0A9P8XZ48_9PEZI|nr:uncharacterized protein B0I36DRAFT_30202 [Microdochium trichocladiopsis]KAH7021218.1 hypothetical protein B0I36DRAFT_30202 [Microdochium trichocladiopsis]